MRFYKDFGGDDTIIEILELPLDDTMNYGGEVAQNWMISIQPHFKNIITIDKYEYFINQLLKYKYSIYYIIWFPAASGLEPVYIYLSKSKESYSHGFKHYPPKNMKWDDIVNSTKSGPAKFK